MSILKRSVGSGGMTGPRCMPNAPRRFTGRSIEHAIEQAVFGLLGSTPTYHTGLECAYYDVTISATTCEYNLDLGKLWIRQGDWTELIRKYMDRETTRNFIGSAMELRLSGKAGSVAMVFNKKPVVTSQRKGLYGNCLLAVTYRTDGARHELVVSSRASYLGWTGLLDCGIAHALAREIFGDPSAVSFSWQVQVAKFHNFNSLLYLWSIIGRDNERSVWRNDTPGWGMVKRENARIEREYAEYGDRIAERAIEPYTGRLRLNRKWLVQYHRSNVVKHPGSLWPKDLNFDRLE